jgi:transposase
MVRKRKYTAEFKAEAVKLAKSSGKPLTEVAKDLGIPHDSLYGWVRKSQPAAEEPPLSESERAELNRLRKDNERLQMEREFLKKAAAFFAKENH